jgi:hypothetical protein
MAIEEKKTVEENHEKSKNNNKGNNFQEAISDFDFKQEIRAEIEHLRIEIAQLKGTQTIQLANLKSEINSIKSNYLIDRKMLEEKLLLELQEQKNKIAQLIVDQQNELNSKRELIEDKKSMLYHL